MVVNEIMHPHNAALVSVYLVKYIYLIRQVSVQYHRLLHEKVWYFYDPNASENAAHKCNSDMHANKCNKMFIIHTTAASCSFSHKVPSNLPLERIDSN